MTLTLTNAHRARRDLKSIRINLYKATVLKQSAADRSHLLALNEVTHLNITNITPTPQSTQQLAH
jgi:hypothetical protein